MTLFERGQRYIGEITEIPGPDHHPLIQWWLSLCWLSLQTPDETPWCSAFVNGLAWDLRLPRSKSAAARSWLGVGLPIPLSQAKAKHDIVILSRGPLPQPGPEMIEAPGHVGIFAGIEGESVLVLGGNQSNAVNIARYPVDRVLGVRRLA